MSKGMMGEISVSHKGGDSKSRPSTKAGGHKEQKPGMAGQGVKLADMSWKGKGLQK